MSLYNLVSRDLGDAPVGGSFAGLFSQQTLQNGLSGTCFVATYLLNCGEMSPLCIMLVLLSKWYSSTVKVSN